MGRDHGEVVIPGGLSELQLAQVSIEL
jgi:hypothetical protein